MAKNYKIATLFLLIVLFLTSGFGCANKMDKETRHKMRRITLNYWRVWDGPDDFAEIIEQYHRLHPNITINYRKLRYEEYEQALIEAFAVDRGPDIFSIHNTWMRKYQSKGLLAPVPDKIMMVYPQAKGNIKKEVVYKKITRRSITPAQVKNDYVDVVYNDVVIKTKDEESGQIKEMVYGLPLSVDTLAMYYNRDLFNNAGITAAPEYWNREFQQDVKKLTKQNNKGEIIQSGVALGGADNIERAPDILSVLMMQNGAVMMDGNQVTFHRIPPVFKSREYNPGLDALRFYTDFANPAKEVYSWNETLDSSLDLFIQNKLAIMFGYSYMLPIIKSRAPKLNFAIAPLPQIEGNLANINFANYWVEVVSHKSKNKEEAWDFIQFAANKKWVTSYLDKTGRPPALRFLVDKYKDNPETGVFTAQVLTAKSWYRGNDAPTAEKIMKEMIKEAVNSPRKLNDIINFAARKIQQTVTGN